MATKKKMLQAAAGNATGGAGGLNVEDVFSTYLYEGNGASQSIENGIALGDFGVGTSTEFDGVSDYLTKTFSAGTFGSGSKTFTFSAWFWWDGTTSETIFQFATLLISANQPAGNILTVSGFSNTYATVLGAQSSAALNKNSWNHLLVSIDLSNTANRHIYINDASASSIYPTYANTAIGFDVAGVATVSSSSAPWTGKLAHVYLDYTYRDLSNSANRRLFIDANGGSTSPSTLSALSPILYFPMTEDYSIGENLGTGGDFTANGSPTIVQSGTEYQDGYGEGGLVWVKNRESSDTLHQLFDTERGAGYTLRTSNNTFVPSASTDAQSYNISRLSAFNSDGFSVGSGSCNTTDQDFTSWTFRKAPKFFDVVTYTGTGSTQAISHNLGCEVGAIFVKNTTQVASWSVYHKDILSTQSLYLNLTNAATTSSAFNTTATDSVFYVDSSANTNTSGETYVAYLFAHNDGDGEFGPDGDADIIKCGSYTGNSGTQEIDLGFEPQWILTKRATNAGQYDHWKLHDVMRGLPTGSSPETLYPNVSGNGQFFGTNWFDVTSTGFKAHSDGTYENVSGSDYIYIAIRRGTKVPESGTEVFDIDTSTDAKPVQTTGFPVDLGFGRDRRSGQGNLFLDRLRGGAKWLDSTTTAAESTATGDFISNFDSNTSWAFNLYGTATTDGKLLYAWKRAPKFFDVVAYTGNGVAGRTVSHNLGVAPEMIWVKSRNNTVGWQVYHKDTGNTSILSLNTSNAVFSPTTSWNSTTPSASEFTVGSVGNTNASTYNYIAYLFASLAGVSKVGSYTGNGSSQTIDCGFTSGARFVLIKISSGVDPWYVFDTERGITVNATDGLLQMNDTAAEYAESAWFGVNAISPHSSGFIVESSLNLSGSDYIFYAIA